MTPARRGIVLVFRTVAVAGYRCRACSHEWGTDPDEPAPTQCPRTECPSRKFTKKRG